MGLVIGAIVILVFAIVFLITGIVLEREGKYFEAHKRNGKAEIVGYDSSPESSTYAFSVKILDLNDGKLYTCPAGKRILTRYRKGDIVNVLYAPKRVVGLNVVEVYLIDNLPRNRVNLGCTVKNISFVLLGIAIIMGIVGILI